MDLFSSMQFIVSNLGANYRCGSEGLTTLGLVNKL